MNTTAIEIIHESLVNGNRRQMVEQIQEYGLYAFFADFKTYLVDLYSGAGGVAFSYFADCTISFMRITKR
jgi:hypothetical protein